MERALHAPADHFPHLTAESREALFERAPGGLASGDRMPLGLGLGATLYIPGDDPLIFAKLRRTLDIGALAAVICLEDSVRLDQVAAAERNVVQSLLQADDETAILPPRLFLRTRTPEQFESIVRALGGALRHLTGVCIPKFDSSSAEAWFDVIDRATDESGHGVQIMPILEGPRALYPESRRGVPRRSVAPLGTTRPDHRTPRRGHRPVRPSRSPSTGRRDDI